MRKALELNFLVMMEDLMMSPWKENPILALYLFLYICGWDKNIPGSRRGLTNYCLALNLEIPLGVVMEEDLMVTEIWSYATEIREQRPAFK